MIMRNEDCRKFVSVVFQLVDHRFIKLAGVNQNRFAVFFVNNKIAI